MQAELPGVAWDLIGRFLDRPVKPAMTWAKLPYTAEKPLGRVQGEEIEGAVAKVQDSRAAVFMTRGNLERYAGYVAPNNAQRASLYAHLIKRRTLWDQTVGPDPVEDLEEMRELGLAFDPWETLDEALAPNWLRHPWQTHGSLFDHDLPNPYTYMYIVQQLGDAARVGRLSGPSAEAVRAKRSSVLHIKAYFFALFAAGLPVNALATGGDAEVTNKYAALGMLLRGWLTSFLTAVLGMMVRLGECINLDWYRGMSEEAQATVDLVALAMTLYALYLLTRQGELNLVVPKSKKMDQFLGQVLSEKGMIYRVRVNGREIELTAGDEGAGCHQDEMAMPGSQYFPCRAQPIGAILVTNDGSNIQLFGTFWRMDEYLITARHCSNTLAQSTSRVYLASIQQTKKGNYEINKNNMFRAPDDFFAPENNVIAGFEIDAFAREVDLKTWSLIGLTKASTKIRSAYKQQIHSVGFTGDGLLVSASGWTLENSGHELLHHNASTQKGFSGSILLCGNSVVGMHVSAAGDYNVAIRVELIQYMIDVGTGLENNSKNKKKYTYADASYKDHYRQHKWRGGVVSLKTMRDGKFAVVLDNGEATYGWDLKGLVECFGATGNPARDEDIFEDLIMDSRGVRVGNRDRFVEYDDERYHRNTFENASIISSGRKRSAKKRPAKTVVVQEKECAYVVTPGLKPIHGPTAPKEQPEATQVVEDFKQEIEELGYEEGQFAYPDMSPVTERKSLESHLRLFHKRTRNVSKPPTEAEMKRCTALVAQMLEPASFVPDVGYRTEAGVLDVIHSTIIDPKKASGYPYCEIGQPTNKQVLASYGEKGFATHVLNEWDNQRVEAKVFLKGEPTKKSKLAKGMARVITGFPLHKTVQHAAIFKPLMLTLVKQWRKIPVKFAFSPAQPGHIGHLKDVLPGKVWESDKSTWDYTMFLWIANCCRDTTKMLALKPPSWTEEQHQQYLTDIDGAFKQVFEETLYRTSDGHLYKPSEAGIMKSGWFMTIAQNSIAQLVVHVMTCIRLEMSDDEILALAVVAGGDDVNQEPVPSGVKSYVEKAAELGVEMEIHERDDLYSSEYFSSDLRLGKEGPEFYPKRWTKHIEHLKVIKRDCLGGALISHMGNYRHDVKKFDCLQRMYHALNEKYPTDFPLDQLVSRNLLLAKQYGYEHVEWAC
nr:MAG: protease polymerase P70 [Chemarfal virus 35]